MKMTRFTGIALLAALLSGTALAGANARDLQQEYDQVQSGQPVTQEPPVYEQPAYEKQGQLDEDEPAQPRTVSNIQMISGGIADSGMDDISAVQNHYDLKLVFADTQGAYLADISVQVKDRQGNTVVDTDSSGPVMLMKLEPGSYTVNSSVSGASKTEQIKVSGHGLKTYILHIPAQES